MGLRKMTVRETKAAVKRSHKGVSIYVRSRLIGHKRCRWITRSVNPDFKQSIWKEFSTKCQSKDGNKCQRGKWERFFDQLQNFYSKEKVQSQNVVLLTHSTVYFS